MESLVAISGSTSSVAEPVNALLCDLAGIHNATASFLRDTYTNALSDKAAGTGYNKRKHETLLNALIPVVEFGRPQLVEFGFAPLGRKMFELSLE